MSDVRSNLNSGMDDPSTQAMSAMLETGRVLGSTLELLDVMQTSIAAACELTGLRTGAIYLLGDDTLHLQATEPPLPDGFPEALLSASVSEHPHIKQCIATGTVLSIDDTGAAALTPAERAVCEARQLSAILYVPLEGYEGVSGAFILGATDSETRLDDVDAGHVSELASHIALAIANSQLHATLARANVDRRHAYDDALTGWAEALEARDHTTGGHSTRVEALTICLAEAMGIPGENLEHVRRGVLLHDIGKMIVPDAVLMKAGPLSEEEWAIMHQHPATARDFMADIEFLRPAIAIPYGHHERWDGSGYPRGLSGADIPLEARIFAVVDVYDALTSDRPYRKAWSRADALGHIEQGSGSHFDPDVVEVFLRVIAEESC